MAAQAVLAFTGFGHSWNFKKTIAELP